MASTRLKRAAAIGIMVVCAGVVVTLVVRKDSSGETSRFALLSDGSTFEIRTIALATNFRYNHEDGNRVQRMLAPITPIFIKNRFWPSPAGGFGFGSDGNTNLFIITVDRNRAPNWWSAVGRLAVFDDQGNFYDSCWGANTLGGPGEVVHGWQIRAFPRRSKLLGLRFLANPGGTWTNAAEFKIRNPAHAEYPQWTPEPWPSTKRDGNLAVTLSAFQSGDRMFGDTGRGDEQTAPRKTRLVFSFAEDGQPMNNRRVQKLTISDATGNRWSPYLDFVKQDFNWVTNGTVEFLGALWPGENAWKFDVEFVRTAGFGANELWEVPPIQLPASGSLTDLTNHWQYDGVSVQLVALASPNTDHSGQFKWIARWWGEDKNKVYSLALKTSPELKGHRLTVVRAVDQDEREVEIVQHGSQDNAEQAVFLKPQPESRELKLTFALQRSRFVQSLARPEFIKVAPGAVEK